jgi:hypothetical protein
MLSQKRTWGAPSGIPLLCETQQLALSGYRHGAEKGHPDHVSHRLACAVRNSKFYTQINGTERLTT